MSFNSIEFLYFLPIVFLLYWFIFRRRNSQNLFIIIASYVFYGWWDWRFLLLIITTSFFSFYSGILLEHYEGNNKHKKIVASTNIILNIGILGVFKYYNFFVKNLHSFFNILGWNLDWITLNIILPIGISFYTFQAISYTIDVYKQKIPVTHNIIEFFAYICFFPQLVAGPIERATNLLPQFQKEREFQYSDAVDGCRQMLLGFMKKLIVADNCAKIVNTYWNQYADLPGITLIIIAALFSFQIYCDFSGYSDIAIGCARLFGFNLMKNFDNPYFSRSIPEFWHRWHISLTTWFRDYIYFPLGGSHCSKTKNICNIYIVWGLTGLWHGANWTFVCWGLYNATLLSIYKILNINIQNSEITSQNRSIPTIKDFLLMTMTFFLTIIGMIIFRAENMTQAISYLSAIVTNTFYDSTKIYGLKYLGYALLLLGVEWLQRDKKHAMQFSKNSFISKHPLFRYILYYFIIMLSITFTGKHSEFIYFQF